MAEDSSYLTLSKFQNFDMPLSNRRIQENLSENFQQPVTFGGWNILERGEGGKRGRPSLMRLALEQSDCKLTWEDCGGFKFGTERFFFRNFGSSMKNSPSGFLRTLYTKSARNTQS